MMEHRLYLHIVGILGTLGLICFHFESKVRLTLLILLSSNQCRKRCSSETSIGFKMITLCLLAFIVSFVFVLILKKKKLRSELPPGPTPWPFIGNLIQIDEKDPRRTFLKWRQKYGPVYTVWSGSEAQVLVCDSTLMQETFTKCAEFCTDRPSNWIFEYLLKGK